MRFSMARCFYHIAALLACPMPGSAAAAWDRVAWGMNSEQIAQAYGARALVLTQPIVFGDSYVDVVLRGMPFADYPFLVYFQMDPRSHRLAHVMLERRHAYASPKVWNAVLAQLREELGPETLACDRPRKRGKPTDIAGIWQLPDETVKATFLDFAAPMLGYDLYPERRILIRYSPPNAGAAACS